MYTVRLMLNTNVIYLREFYIPYRVGLLSICLSLLFRNLIIFVWKVT
jgi:hypothetical protein